MPEIRFDSEWVKANLNVVQGDKLRYLDTGQKDSKGRWVFQVAIVSGKTGKVRCQKKFSLNKANFDATASFYSSNSDNWIGKEMTVNVVRVNDPSGKPVNGIRLAGKNDILADTIDLDSEETGEFSAEEKSFLEE